jgi:hypothetical protein
MVMPIIRTEMLSLRVLLEHSQQSFQHLLSALLLR